MRTAIVLAVLAAPLSAHATGMYQCEATDKADWLSEDAMTAQLVDAGWDVRRMKPDGGCWEVYGTTPEGKRVEGYFHPVSGEMLLLNQRGKILFRKEGS